MYVPFNPRGSPPDLGLDTGGGDWPSPETGETGRLSVLYLIENFY